MGNIDPLWIVIGAAVVAGIAAAVVLVARSGKGRMSQRWTGGRKVRGQAPTVVKPAKRTPRGASAAPRGSLISTALRPIASMWRLGDTSQSRLQETLVHGGIREKGAVEIFLGAKLALAIALPTAALAATVWWQRSSDKDLNVRTLFISGAMALVLGLMVPNMWLRSKAKARISRIRLSLPDALDLLIVCIEAGLGLDAALVRLSQEMEDAAPELCEELLLLNLEISAGKPRTECLRNLALRTGCEEMESLVARINQATKYGTNLGHSLRIHSDSLRLKRRQEAEERAAKTTVKLLFPLVFFIFPAIFVVILGPGLVKVLEMLKKQ